MTTHIECGVHGVGEVGGLQGDRAVRWGSGAGLCGPGTPPPPPFHHPAQYPWSPHPQPFVPVLEASSSVLPAHLVRVQGEVGIQ